MPKIIIFIYELHRAAVLWCYLTNTQNKSVAIQHGWIQIFSLRFSHIKGYGKLDFINLEKYG